MSILIIDPAAGLATKPRGADVSNINVFSLATAPWLGVKIVLHLISMQFFGPASRLQRSASGFCSYQRHWPWQEALPRASDRREGGPKLFSQGGRSSVRITLPLHHIFLSKLYRRTSQPLIFTMNWRISQPMGRGLERRGPAGACPWTWLLNLVSRYKFLFTGSGPTINNGPSEPRPAVWLCSIKNQQSKTNTGQPQVHGGTSSVTIF